MTNVLNDLTIVVPSYERHPFVLRLMRFWSGRGPRVLVIDGSSHPISKNDLIGLNDGICYIHSPVGLYKRLEQALLLIETKYVILACDDEFYVPTALNACIYELENDPELVACGGRSLGFEVDHNEVLGRVLYPKLEGYKVCHDDPQERVTSHMGNYVPSQIYAVCRRLEWVESFSYITRHEFNIFAIGEIQFEMCMSFAGKSKVIPNLMWLRSLNENSAVRGTDPSLDLDVRFQGWWLDPAKHQERDHFVRVMKSAFSSLKPVVGYDYRKVVLAACEKYYQFVDKNISARCARDVRFNLVGVCWFFRKKVSAVIPDYVKAIIKHYFLAKKCQSKTFIDAAKTLRLSGVDVDLDSLTEIEDILIDFHRSESSLSSLV